MHTIDLAQLQPWAYVLPQVEAEFETKFGDMSAFDSFMDYNAALLTADLDYYAAAFDADQVAYLPIEWVDQAATYHGIIVHVPTSQVMWFGKFLWLTVFNTHLWGCSDGAGDNGSWFVSDRKGGQHSIVHF